MRGEEAERRNPQTVKFKMIKIIQLAALIDRRAVKRCADRVTLQNLHLMSRLSGRPMKKMYYKKKKEKKKRKKGGLISKMAPCLGYRV